MKNQKTKFQKANNKQQIRRKRAAICTCGQKPELLTGKKARSVAALREAARALSANGTGAVIVTGVVLDDTPSGLVETVLCLADTLHRVPNPRLPIRPSGTGDLFAALLVAELCDGNSLAASIHAASQEILAILQRTYLTGSNEMVIIAQEVCTRTAGQT
jgi:pyridoxine kinase